MEIGIQTSIITNKFGMKKALKMIAEAGFQTLDFNIDGDWMLTPTGEKILLQSEEEVLEHIRSLKELIVANGLRVEQMHGPNPTHSTDPEEQKLIVLLSKRSIAAAGALGCPYIIIHPPHLGFDANISRKETLELNKRLFDQLFEDLERHNVEACLENMFRDRNGKAMASACAHPHEALEYVNALNEMAGAKRVSFCFDTGHALLASLDIYQTIVDLAPILTTLHIHDNDGIGDLHRMPWNGAIDWERFARALRDINYQGVLSFETFSEYVVHPPELMPEVLQLIAAMGRHFVDQIEAY